MDYRLLLYFSTLINQGSFTKAARNLHISQPSLSSAIKKLENSMKLKLIERNTRNISLTKEGEILYIEAQKLLNHFQYVENEMNRLKDEGPLELQIGLIESVNSWLPKVLASFSKSNPDIHIKLLEVLGLKQVESALQNYKIHLAITNQHIDNKDIITTPIYNEQLVAVIPIGHHLQHVKDLSLYNLENEKLIVSREGFQTRQDIFNEFRKLGIVPNIIFEIERFETACSLVGEGLGITVIPESYMRFNFASNSFVIKPINSQHLFRTVYIAYIKSRYLPPIVETFLNLTKSSFADETNKEI
ncbi:MAG TPA: LysR family transcriptional regulator [Virgibacillus sp.]|nr:LysR family transcriptional regulator [Virgibacillus sp.]HLR69093.1 LysR family transcriptional regulator [Virgibacillus sp.]